MKKIFTLFLIIVGLFVAFKIGNLVYKKVRYNMYVKEVKKDWYVEVTTDVLKVREHPTATSRKLAEAKRGEVFAVLDYDVKDEKFYWYHIKMQDGTKGWLANPKAMGKYLKDYNGEEIDVATPTISFKENEYHVVSIKDINYDHLKAWDDRKGYKITHVVCHEVDEEKDIDQYWIKYTITDKSKKSSSKVQKIIFEKLPSEEDVIDFSEC